MFNQIKLFFEQHDYFEFTYLINKEYTLEQKIRLIESLWKIAFKSHLRCSGSVDIRGL
jgi:uncharacterized tellurite resistance protein B-like protein